MDWDAGFSASSPEYHALLDEEMEEFRSEKSVKANKSPEEIQRLMVDENLSEMDRACLLINTGIDVQKICVISHLPNLLKTNQMDVLSRIVPKLNDLLPSASAEVHAAVSKAYAEIATQGVVPIHVFVTTCLPTVLLHLESKDSVIAGTWLNAILAIIPHLPKEMIKRHILTVAVAKGQLSQMVSSRQASCRIIGAMAHKFEPFWLKRELLALATTLCQDVDAAVRKVMCQQLLPLAKSIGLVEMKSSILPELNELVKDEECSVRVAAFDTLTELISFLEAPTLQTQIVPLMRKFCESSYAACDDSLPVVARNLGLLCHNLKTVMTTEEHDWFIDFYCKLSKHCEVTVSEAHCTTASSLSLVPVGDDLQHIECRRFCAYNFPAMVLFVGTKRFETKLAQVLRLLAEDSNWRVRRTVACGFHEVTKKLDTRCLEVVSVFQSLLRDSSGEVLLEMVKHMPEVMEAFAKHSNLAPVTQQPGLLDFIPPLLACEKTASQCRQWRCHEQLLANLVCLVNCMTSAQLYETFAPLMFKYILGSYVLPVKIAASKTLCVYIRNIRKHEQRQELLSKLTKDCGKSTSCRQRILFIDICTIILETFSRCYFKENLFEDILELANDSVVNVRLRLCQILPDLKSIIKLPGDRALLQKLEQTVRKLISQERDPDASQAIREAVVEMDRIEVAMESLTRRTYFESDLIDQRREEEEKALLQAEQKEKEREKEKQATKKHQKQTSSKLSAPQRSSSTSLNAACGGVSPTTAFRNSMVKSRNTSSPTASKSFSAPSGEQVLSISSGSSSPSTIHGSPGRIRRRSADRKVVCPSPISTGKGSKVQTSSNVSSSKLLASKSSNVTKGTQNCKKAQQYGLEYAKSKRKT